MSILKTLTINDKVFQVTPVVPASSITLLASAWAGDGDAYSQMVAIPGVTNHTKVDLQPTAEQLAEFRYKDLAFVAENDGGTITVYAIGDKPMNSHTIQVTMTEVEGTGKIRGNTVGTTLKPDKSLVKATNLTEEEKAIVRKNIGAAAENGADHYETITEQIVSDSDFSIDGFCRPAPKSGELFGTNTGYCRTDYIDISAYTSLTIHTRPRSDSCSPCVWFDATKTYISGETAEILEESDYTYDVPEDAVYAIFSSEKTIENKRYVNGVKTVFVPGGGGGITLVESKCYISPNGSDDNDGLTPSTPVLTINRVKEIISSNGELVFMGGDYHNFSYDLSLFSKVSTTDNVRWIYYSTKFTSATLLDGYTRIYVTPYTGSYSNYLWQLDVPDLNTAISAEERHPLQRNRACRLEHTRIYPVTKFDTTSTDLAGYLATMEATTDKRMYYMDGTNCYFTAPSDDFEYNPIIIPGSTVLKATSKREVSISNLKIYFASILTTNLSGVLDNLTVGYHTKNGAIMWDNTFNLTLNNCEVAASTNDGINGHTAGDIVCYNCWGHDNADDGESDHEECHIIQYGGLYEYNGNGCTPASGASGEYFDTICRNNGAWDWVSDPAGTGFSAQSTSTTGAATMYCVGCCSTGNKIGFRQKNSSRSTFINCVSKDDETAFDSGTQINCAVADSYVTMVATLGDGSTVTYKVLGEAVTE